LRSSGRRAPGLVEDLVSFWRTRRKAITGRWAREGRLDARLAEPRQVGVPWNLYALRKRWNAEKAVVAPWWAEKLQGGDDTGIADWCAALREN